MTDPAVLVEVLSPSTQAYDRGEKLWHYQQIPSLTAVLFVSQDERRVEVVRWSSGDAWSQAIYIEGAVPLDGASLDVASVYGA